MLEPGPPAAVYRLRVVVAGVSPLIWRRLIVRDDMTITGLGEVLQTAFGWSGEHLCRFTVHGAEHEPCYGGGRVRLREWGLREGERFAYDYNFTAGWRLDLRVEQITDAAPGRVYPRCAGGRRAGPDEDWDGPWDYLDRTQPHRVFDAIVRAAAILREVLDADPDTTVAAALGDDGFDELRRLAPLLGLDQFDRRALNTTLAHLTPATTQRTPP